MAGRPQLYFKGVDAAVAYQRLFTRRLGTITDEVVQSHLRWQKSTYCRGFLITLMNDRAITWATANRVWGNLARAHPEWKAGLIEPEYAREALDITRVIGLRRARVA